MDPRAEPVPDSPAAWWRLAASLALMTIGSAGMHVVSVGLPVVQSEFGVARAAAALPYTALLIGFGVGGLIMDRLGGLRTLLLGSVLQGLALLLFLPFDSLGSMYLVSALFGLFQGGIVPSCAIVVREHFPAAGAAQRVSIVLTATLLGMALGGWMSGKVFDLSGSYDAAFVNGVAWNLLNLAIVVTLLRRSRHSGRRGLPPGPSRLVRTAPP